MTARPHKVISISMYLDDLAQLDEKVAALKRLGWSDTSRSSLIRQAVAEFDVATVPPRHEGP